MSTRSIVDADGNLLVSARNTWTVYKIDRTTGKVIWRLGGKKSDFAMGPGTQVRLAARRPPRRRRERDDVLRQRRRPAGGAAVARARRLSLDLAKKRATLVHQYVHRPKMLAHAFGSVQTQPNGNVLVGWATEPYFTEYTAAGAVLLDAKLPYGGQNYRTLRFPWSAIPAEPPRLAARPTPSGTLLYATLERGDRRAGLAGAGRPEAHQPHPRRARRNEPDSRPGSTSRPVIGTRQLSRWTPAGSRSAARQPLAL